MLVFQMPGGTPAGKGLHPRSGVLGKSSKSPLSMDPQGGRTDGSGGGADDEELDTEEDAEDVHLPILLCYSCEV